MTNFIEIFKEFFTIWASVTAVVSLIVKLTPTPIDDTVWYWIKKILETVALNKRR